MLSSPLHGWTDFQLLGTSKYSLSYLDDIPFEWLDQAIHGLESMLPFTVEGFLEPERFLCTVSYWNCYVLIEDDERDPMSEERVSAMRPEVSHTSMLEFCKLLYADISSCRKKWYKFCYHEISDKEMAKLLDKKLKRLKKLIKQKEVHFSEGHCFF